MKRFVWLCGLVCLVGAAWGQTIVVNEYLNESSASDEYVELLVLQDKLDLRGYTVRDFTGSGSEDDILTFTTDPLWECVRSGYLIVIALGSASDEVSFSDGVVTISQTNTSYFSRTGILNIAAGADGVEVRDALGQHIHALVHNPPSGSAAEAAVTGSNAGVGVTFSGSMNSGEVIRFIDTDEALDFDASANAELSTAPSPGDPNDAVQQAYKAKLLPIWINEISTDQGTDDLEEFIEVVGPTGFNFSDYRIRVFSCPSGTPVELFTEEVSTFNTDGTFDDVQNKFGFFVLGSPLIDFDQEFTGVQTDRLPDDRGIVVILEPDPSTVELFGYGYGVSCLDGRTMRSLQDDALPSSTMGFVSDTKPDDSDTGSDLLTKTPGQPNESLDGNAQALPVELTAFEAVADGDAVTLRWETASETNNAGFFVELRGERAAHAPWEALDFVDGHGTTLEAQAYTYRLTGLEPGRYVFRLKQIDYDGTFDYSPQVEIAVGVPEAFQVSEAYPNPFNPRTQFSVSVARRQHVVVQIIDLTGRRVAVPFNGVLDANQARSVVFEAASLPSGVYLLHVTGEHFTTSQTVTLVK